METSCIIKTYHDNHNKIIKEEYYQNNGKKEGVYKTYYYNGQIKFEVNYIDGKKEG